ncbi:hypothetical protein Tco_0566318 [Tanacetum coccineum]
MRDVHQPFIITLHPNRGPTIVTYSLPAPPSLLAHSDIPEADTPPRKRLLLTTPRPGCEVGESFAAAAARQPGPNTLWPMRDDTIISLYQVDVRRERVRGFTHESDAQTGRAAMEELRLSLLSFNGFIPASGGNTTLLPSWQKERKRKNDDLSNEQCQNQLNRGRNTGQAYMQAIVTGNHTGRSENNDRGNQAGKDTGLLSEGAIEVLCPTTI